MCVLSLSVCRCTSQDISVLTGSKCLSIVAYVFPPLGSIASYKLEVRVGEWEELSRHVWVVWSCSGSWARILSSSSKRSFARTTFDCR